MVQRTHGIEGVSRVPRTRRDGTLGGGKIGVGMSEAYANASTGGFGDHFWRLL